MHLFNNCRNRDHKQGAAASQSRSTRKFLTTSDASYMTSSNLAMDF